MENLFEIFDCALFSGTHFETIYLNSSFSKQTSKERDEIVFFRWANGQNFSVSNFKQIMSIWGIINTL